MDRKEAKRLKAEIRKKVGLKLAGRHVGYRELGVMIASKTGWVDEFAPNSKGAGRRLVHRYWTELMGGEIPTFERGASRVKQPKRAQKSDWQKKSKDFFASDAWRKLRYRALQVCGGKCQCCGARQIDGVVLHVDHIKPRYRFQHLELEITNLQVLCEDCNIGKGAWDETDWRTNEQRQQLEHMKSINERPI